MISISLKSNKETFNIAGQKFEARFTDSSLKQFWEEGKKVNESDAKYSERHKDLSILDDPKQKTTSTDAYKIIASAALDSIPTNCQAYKKFFDSIFGSGSGDKIYNLCGNSTPNMGRVFDAIWQTILKHMYERTENRNEGKQKR